MDGGAWLPLRTRYLPRWHHSGSYQLHPGERELDLGPEGGAAGPRGNINTHQGSGLPQHGFRGAFEVLGSREATWAESPNAYFLRYFFSC